MIRLFNKGLRYEQADSFEALPLVPKCTVEGPHTRDLEESELAPPVTEKVYTPTLRPRDLWVRLDSCLETELASLSTGKKARRIKAVMADAVSAAPMPLAERHQNEAGEQPGPRVATGKYRAIVDALKTAGVRLEPRKGCIEQEKGKTI